MRMQVCTYVCVCVYLSVTISVWIHVCFESYANLLLLVVS